MKRVGVVACGIALAVAVVAWTAWHASRPAFSYTPVPANMIVAGTPVVLTDGCEVRRPDALRVVLAREHGALLRVWMASHDFELRREVQVDTVRQAFWEVGVPDGAAPDAALVIGALPGVIDAEPIDIGWIADELVIACLESRPLHSDTRLW